MAAEFPPARRVRPGRVATERSPYGFDLGVSCPRVVGRRRAAVGGAWRDAGLARRRSRRPDGVCLRSSTGCTRIFELANAVQHTSGQAFVMAFQAGGAHALDRALEAIAYAWAEMHRTPATALWEKPGRGEPLRMEKTFTVVPRGVALVIGCNTFPTWNSWPGLFAFAGHRQPGGRQAAPAAVLPLAITVQVCQEVLVEAGFDADLVTLAAEARRPPGRDPRRTPEVKLVDFTGGNAFGDWLEEHAPRPWSSPRRPG